MNGYLAGVVASQRGGPASLRPRPLVRFEASGPDIEATAAGAPLMDLSQEAAAESVVVRPRPSSVHPATPSTAPTTLPALPSDPGGRAAGPSADVPAPRRRSTRSPVEGPAGDRETVPVTPALPTERATTADAAPPVRPPIPGGREERGRSPAAPSIDPAPASQDGVLVPARPAEIPPATRNRDSVRLPTVRDHVPATPPAPVVHVTIGRLEVRATVEEAAPRPPAGPRGVMSLDDYVAQKRSVR